MCTQTIIVCNRFLHGRKHPKRLRRVDSFSYFIPGALKEDLARFVSNSTSYDACVARAEAEAAAAAAAALAEEERLRLLAALADAEPVRKMSPAQQRLAAKKWVIVQCRVRASAETTTAQHGIISVNSTWQTHAVCSHMRHSLSGALITCSQPRTECFGHSWEVAPAPAATLSLPKPGLRPCPVVVASLAIYQALGAVPIPHS
jgi:hypothetical protein